MLETAKPEKAYGVKTNPTKIDPPMRLAVLIEGHSLADAYLRRIEISRKERVYLVKKDGQYKDVLWEDIHSQILGIFGSYRTLGIKKGSKVAILSNTRPEWTIADIATFSSGAVTVPVYPSSSVDDVRYILEHSEAELVFADDETQCRKLHEVFEKTKRPIPVVHFSELSPISGLNTTCFGKFAAYEGSKELEKAFQTAARAVMPNDLASIVYTSGTTGVPKGACLTHSNFTSGIRAVITEVEITNQDVGLTFLPFAHILGRFESLSPIFCGVTLGFAESINSVAQNIQEVRPTFMISVPRIYEKIYAKILGEVQNKPDFSRNIFHWALEVGKQVARLRSEKMPIPILLMLKFKIADSLAFQKIRAKLGGRIRITASGGAPLSPEICEFFHACGIKILEGWGLTETLGPIVVNHPNDYRFGTVGKPMKGLEIKIARDGEILVRGPMITREYYKNPGATQEAITPDGWFATGDIGEIDDRGFLRITDRKKELIVTSAGKKIAPQKLENSLKTKRLISNAMVYGDKQKYISALITLNEEEIKSWAKAQGIAFGSYSELTENPKLVAWIDSEVESVNGVLASFETIKKFKILPHDFTTETGELTPSLKLKRKVISEKYKSVIEQMYG